MPTIRTCLGRLLSLAAYTLTSGVLLFVCIPQVTAEPWWYPVSMRITQYSGPRAVLPKAAASGIAAASVVTEAPGIAAASSVHGIGSQMAAASAVIAISSVAAP